jgi:hypothetical protein
LIAQGVDFEKIIPVEKKADEKEDKKKAGGPRGKMEPKKGSGSGAPAKKDVWNPKALAIELLKQRPKTTAPFSFNVEGAFGDDAIVKAERLHAQMIAGADDEKEVKDGDLARGNGLHTSAALLPKENTGLLAGNRAAAGAGGGAGALDQSVSVSVKDGDAAAAAATTSPTSGLPKPSGQLIADEERVQGKVSWKVYEAWAMAAGGLWVGIGVVICMGLMTGRLISFTLFFIGRGGAPTSLDDY